MSSPPSLLILDYPGRRPEAHLDELGLEDLGFECRYLLTSPMPDEVTCERYARALADGFGAGDGTVRGVISYCAAAPLATELAALASRDRPVPVVLLDPFDCDEHHIAGQYALVARQIDSGGPRGDGPPLLDVAAGIGEPRELATRITRDLSDRAKRSLEGGGDDLDAEEMAALVVRMYVDWLKFLLAVYHRPRDARQAVVLHVASSQGTPGPQWPGAVEAETATIGCEHADLARSQETRKVIIEFIERWL